MNERTLNWTLLSHISSEAVNPSPRLPPHVFSFKCWLTGFLLIVPSFAVGSGASSNDIRFTHLSTEDGFSHNMVNSILQDRDGFLWFATEDGLDRYDGYSITSFRHDGNDASSISNNYLVSLCEDNEGFLWIAAGEALERYDQTSGKFVHYIHDPTDSSSISRGQPTALFKDSQGRIWVPVYGGGLDLYDRERDGFIHYRARPNDLNGLQSNFVTRIVQDHAGVFWVGTRAGLHQFDPITGRFQVYSHDPKDMRSISPGSSDQTVFEDSHGRLWVQSWDGDLNRLDKDRKEFTHYRVNEHDPHSLADSRLNSVFEDSHGTIWFATWFGLHRYVEADDRFVRYLHDDRNPTSISADRVSCVYEDRSGILWIGTYRGGINRYDRRMDAFRAYLDFPGDPLSMKTGEGVSAVLSDKDGTIWVGTHGEGIFMFEMGRNAPMNLRHRSDAQSLQENHIKSLGEADDGTIWIGYEAPGMSVYDREKGSFRHYKSSSHQSTGLADGPVALIFRDRKGTMWLGVSGNGIDRVDPASMEVTHYRHDPSDSSSLASDNVTAFFQDRRGNLWIGTDRGLDRFQESENRFTHVHVPARIAPFFRAIQSIVEDNSSGLWLATRWNGLFYYDVNNPTIRRVSQRDGLLSDQIKGMMMDQHESIWISTSVGLVKYSPRTHAFQSYRKNDGLPFEEFLSKAYCYGKNGQIWFGGSEGVVGFIPESIKTNISIPPVAITSFRKFDRPMQFDTVITRLKHIVLSHDENFFSFEFSALDYTNAEKNQYAYKMEGFDEDWVFSGTRRFAGYTGLDPGEYFFRVKGSNSDGQWNEQGRSIKVSIVPPYWMTWWFRSITAGLFLFAGFLTYHRRISRLEKEKSTQQAFSKSLIDSQEQERKRISAELHDGLGQDLLIMNNEIQQLMIRKEDSAGELERVAALIKESIDTTREIASNLHPHHLERLGLAAALEAMVEKVSHSSSIRFTIRLEGVDSLIQRDAQISLYRIIQEAVSNIERHSGATEASISFEKEGGKVQITMSDNGKGFDNSIDRRDGLGISNMIERANLLGAKLEFVSVRNGGTTIILRLPLKDSIPHG